MAVCPVLTNVIAELREKYDAAIRDGLVIPVREFRTVSVALGKTGKRRYFVADNYDEPIEIIGFVDATPTIAD